LTSKPNIILVLLDGARWDRLEKSSDFLELQNKGLLLNNVTTAIPYTFGSMNIIFTGKFGKENGVDAYYKMFKLKKEVEFLPEILKDNGYFTCCNLISDKVISSRGFDVYQSHDEYQDNLMEIHPKFIEKNFNESNDKPLFCFLQFSKIHTATVSEILKKFAWNDEKFYDNQEKNMEIYDNAFLESGKYANKIYKTLEKLNKLDNTIVIFFADHGTGIGERFGERNYGIFTYEETIRTFYLFIGPKIIPNKKSDKLRSTIDIFPTIIDMSNSNVREIPIGDTLFSYLTGTLEIHDRDYVFSETGGLQGPFPSPMEPNVFCIKTNNYKLIYFKTIDKWELYDLKIDPNEKNNIFGDGLEIEILLKEKLLNWIKR
jgi:arylsulfatase A-like enzyme